MTFLCNGTPEIAVRDNRGQQIRQLRYNRRDADQPVEELIERRELALTGQPLTLTDARFFAGGGQPNFRYVTSLSGKVLRQTSMDAGDIRAMFTAAGGKWWAQDARGTRSRGEYDGMGRPVVLYQQREGESVERVTDRFIYGETLSDATARNLRGLCTEHYDTGGRLQTGAVTLAGQIQQQTRWLMADAEQDADWQGNDQNAWQTQLNDTGYVTGQTFNACGQLLSLTDAKGNIQTQGYNIAGQTTSSSLQKVDGPLKNIITDTTYSAAGQVLQVVASGGLTRTFSYEDTTQRLLTVVTQRPSSGGGTETLEDVLYGYDPAGNVLSLTDRRQATRWFAGQQVNGSRAWQYDALYQLISASGRENASAGAQSPALPALTTDTSQLVNYQRTYSYDDSFNLVSIAHSGAQQYTQRMVVSGISNRAVSDALAEDITPDRVDGYFDAAGNALWLQAGQALTWNSFSRLSQVTLVVREGQESDREIYQYDSRGNRLRKQTIMLTGNATQTQQVIYLPGLELRVTSTDSGDSVTVNDALVVNVLCGGQGIAARHLYREQGTEDAITGDGQLRLNLGNNTNSVMLEMDGNGTILSREEYFPFGGTAVLAGDSGELKYKYIRYSGKERDATGLYDYGQRYYMPWLGRWASADPAGTVDGSNLYRMVKNNPGTYSDSNGLMTELLYGEAFLAVAKKYNVIIGIRAPNPLSRDLLEQGYPSKNFHMKAKSSISGPTAGFIPERSEYSKVAGNPHKEISQNRAIASAMREGAMAVPLELNQQRISSLIDSGVLNEEGGGDYSASYNNNVKTFKIKSGRVLDSNHDPVKVMTNPPGGAHGNEINKPITADYDLFAIIPTKNHNVNARPLTVPPRLLRGRFDLDFLRPKSLHGAGEDPHMGNIHFFGSVIIAELNKNIELEGYKGGRLVWHNDETGNPFSPGFDENDKPIFFMPSGKMRQVFSKSELLSFYSEVRNLSYSPEYSARLGF